MSNGRIPTDLAGGFKYTPVSFAFGSTNQVINGGYSFDLPLSTVANFTNAALDFNANNSNAARGFLQGVISTAQGNVTAAADRQYELQNQGIRTMDNWASRSLDNQRYAIKKAFKSGGCFITTAVTQAKGLPDNCAELQALRAFRDDYMLQTDEGKALVKLYYDIAPTIVAQLKTNPLSASIFARLDSLFIQPALSYIGAGNFEHAQHIYVALVHEAAKLAGVDLESFSKPAPVCTCNGGTRHRNFHAKDCPIRG